MQNQINDILEIRYLLEAPLRQHYLLGGKLEDYLIVDTVNTKKDLLAQEGLRVEIIELDASRVVINVKVKSKGCIDAFEIDFIVYDIEPGLLGTAPTFTGKMKHRIRTGMITNGKANKVIKNIEPYTKNVYLSDIGSTLLNYCLVNKL